MESDRRVEIDLKSLESDDIKFRSAIKLFGADPEHIKRNRQVFRTSEHGYEKIGHASVIPVTRTSLEPQEPLDTQIADEVAKIDAVEEEPLSNPYREFLLIMVAGRILEKDRLYPRSIMPTDVGVDVRTDAEGNSATRMTLRSIGRRNLSTEIALLHHESEIDNKRKEVLHAVAELHEMACVLDKLHSGYPYPLIHRDVKSANIVVDRNRHYRLLDYGISHIDVPNQRPVGYGTFTYMDSKMMVDDLAYAKSDDYALARVLVEILSGKLPQFPDNPETALSYSFAVMAHPLGGYVPVVFAEDIVRSLGVSEQTAKKLSLAIPREFLGNHEDRLPNARILTGLVLEILTYEFNPDSTTFGKLTAPEIKHLLENLADVVANPFGQEVEAAKERIRRLLMLEADVKDQQSYLDWLELLFGLRRTDRKLEYAERVERLFTALSLKEPDQTLGSTSMTTSAIGNNQTEIEVAATVGEISAPLKKLIRSTYELLTRLLRRK